MLSTVDIWDKLVALAADLEGVQEAKALPLHRVRNAEFLKRFPGLKLPAVLIVNLGHTTTARGAALDRERRWAIIVITRDPKGDAYRDAVTIADSIETGMLDQQVDIKSETLTIHATVDVEPVLTSDQDGVYELAATTREVYTR